MWLDEQQFIDLYFGTWEVFLAPVRGKWNPCFETHPISPPLFSGNSETDLKHIRKLAPFDDPEVRQDLLCRFIKRLSTPQFFSDCNSRIIINAVPAFDLSFLPPSETDSQQLFPSLAQPLIKVSANQESRGVIPALRSGGRSAVSRSLVEGKWLRLKGCGNYVDHDGFRSDYPHFPLREYTLFSEHLGFELRGSSDLHNTLRELYFSHHIQNIISKCARSLQIGNSPLGFWEYQIEGDPHPELEKSCIVFETKGEKRLASHLLTGIDFIIQKGVIPLSHPLFDVFSDNLHKRSHQENRSGEIIPTWIACCTGETPATPIDFLHLFHDPFFLFDGLPTKDRLPLSGSIPSINHLRLCWSENVQFLDDFQKTQRVDLLYLLLKLFWRLGLEVGRFSRLLCDHQIMWGFFFDHNPAEPHCNSHPNNFIVLPPDLQKV